MSAPIYVGRTSEDTERGGGRWYTTQSECPGAVPYVRAEQQPEQRTGLDKLVTRRDLLFALRWYKQDAGG